MRKTNRLLLLPRRPNPVENEEEVQSQPESSPDASMDLSPVDEKKYEKARAERTKRKQRNSHRSK